MAFSVKLLLWPNDPNQHGHLPIYIRIAITGSNKRYISTGYFIDKKHWDGKNEQVKAAHLLHTTINDDILDRKAKILQYIVDCNKAGTPVTSHQVKDRFAKNVDLHNIFDFVDQFRADKKNRRSEGMKDNYKKIAAKLERYHGNRKLNFEQITEDYLIQYEEYLRAAGENPNYINTNFTVLRTFFNAAIKKGIITCYPFIVFEMPGYVAPDKDRLTLAELDEIEKYYSYCDNKYTRQAAAWFLFSCYTGLRISDWYRFDPERHISDNNVLLRAKKNGEWVMLPVKARLQRAIEYITSEPLTIDEITVGRHIRIISKRLKIKKHLTPHIGRHTFAVTMCADQGIGVELCAELMGITVNTCIKNYYRVSRGKIQAECSKAWAAL